MSTTIDPKDVDLKFYISKLYVHPEMAGQKYVIGRIEWKSYLTYQDAEPVIGMGELDIPFNANIEFKPITDITADEVISWIRNALGDAWIDGYIQHLMPALMRNVEKKKMTVWELPLIGQELAPEHG